MKRRDQSRGTTPEKEGGDGSAAERRWPARVYESDDAEEVIRALDAARAAAVDVAPGACHGLTMLVDECVSPLLCLVAREFGYVAHFIHHRGWGTLKDPQILPYLLQDDLTIVTNNRRHWLDLLGKEDLHPGVIVIVKNAPRAVEVEYFTRVMVAIEGLASLVNTAVEVGANGAVTAYDLPE